MALTKESMADHIEARIGDVEPVQTSDASTALAYRRRILEALSQGIIDEIHAHAVVYTDSGAPDGEHVGHVD
jgi:hypothetical protein